VKKSPVDGIGRRNRLPANTGFVLVAQAVPPAMRDYFTASDDRELFDPPRFARLWHRQDRHLRGAARGGEAMFFWRADIALSALSERSQSICFGRAGMIS